MAAPPEAPPSGFWEDSKDGVEVSLLDESAAGFSRTVRAIAELTAGEPELEFLEAEVERIASSVTFLRWKPHSWLPPASFSQSPNYQLPVTGAVAAELLGGNIVAVL
jgi:general transcription factor 3C polypeptide 2